MSTGKANDEKKVSSGGRVSVNWAKRKFLAASSRPSPSASEETSKVSDRQPTTMPLKKSRSLEEVIAVEGVDGSKMPPLKKRRKQKKQQKQSSNEKTNTKEEKSMKSSSIGAEHISGEGKLAKKCSGKGRAAAAEGTAAAVVGRKKRKADGGDKDLPPKEKKTRVGVAADVDAGTSSLKKSPPLKEKTLVSANDSQSIEKKPIVFSQDGCTDLVLKSGACTVVKKSSSREGGTCGNQVQLGLAIALCAGVRLIGMRSQDILQSTGYNTPLALDVKGHWNNAVRGPTGMLSNVVDTKTLLRNKLQPVAADTTKSDADDIGDMTGGKSFKDWRMGIKKRAQKGLVGFRKGYVDLVEKNDFFL